MRFQVMKEEDIARVIPLYLEQYNEYDNGCWTEETAYRRIHQIWAVEDSYCLLAEEDNVLLGFLMGYFKQFDDLKLYHLEEIVIAHSRQGKGLGTEIMRELEYRVKELGGAMITLDAVKDEMHEHFYSKLGYDNVKNFVPKTKMLE